MYPPPKKMKLLHPPLQPYRPLLSPVKHSHPQPLLRGVRQRGSIDRAIHQSLAEGSKGFSRAGPMVLSFGHRIPSKS